MHITFLVKYLGARGGTEEYVRVVGQALLERGHRVSLLYEEPGDLSGSDWARFVREVEHAPAPPGAADAAGALRAELAALRPDVLFLHSVSFSAALYEVAAGFAPVVRFVHDFRPVCLRISKVFPLSRQSCTRALGYGCLLHLCSVGPPRGGERLVSWNSLGAKLEERNTSLRMDRVIVASGFMRDLLLRNGFTDERISVNPLFSPAPPPAQPPPLPHRGRLLYVGQVQQFKGLPVLLQAMSHLPDAICLDVAGDGPWRARCEAQARAAGIADRVRFHGWVQREHLPALIAGAGMVVMPSVWNEPFGLAGVEAMAHGRPVVAFDVGGVREWLDHGSTGLCVESVDPVSLAGAIRQLWDDPARARAMGLRGHRRVRDHLSVERHVGRLLGDFTTLRAAT